jgi:sugar/nucleoside kinase (ribokinase family)
MRILVVGSVALDSVKTPFGEVQEALGGSAVYFSISASYFAPVSLVAVVGQDFPQQHLGLLRARGVDLQGLHQSPGRTFRWHGSYGYDLNEARTLRTELNVFEHFSPSLPGSLRGAQVVFLANIDPELQRRVLQQTNSPRLVAADTMNYWIEHKPRELRETLRLVNILAINEAEARELAQEANLVRAARAIQAMGPQVVVIKRGEYGVLMFNSRSIFSAPAYPLEDIHDPTGAGDTFAGGFLGYLAKARDFSEASMRKALVMGSVMASFAVEGFSVAGIKGLSLKDIEARFQEFKALTHFEAL